MDALKGYEIAVDRVYRMSERRQMSSQIYLAVNTGVLGVLAFLYKDAGFRGWSFVAVSAPLFFVGVTVCIIWYRIISNFQAIMGWHYEKLREIEKAVPESYLVITEEWNKLCKPCAGEERFRFARLEIWLARLFIGPYVNLRPIMGQ